MRLNVDSWMVFRSYLGMGKMELFNIVLWANRFAFRKSIATGQAFQADRFKTVAVFSVSQAAIRRTVHLDPWLGRQIARAINEHARALRAHKIEAAIHWVPGHSGIPGHEQVDRHANTAPIDRAYTVGRFINTSTANRAGLVSEGRMAATAKWEADKCSNHYGYRLKGKSGSKRSVPMTSVNHQ